MAEERANKISNCGHDERRLYSGGQAGDQSKDEYTIRDWYNYPYGGWDIVLRYNGENPEKIRRTIANIAILAANNDNIGYDQGQRGTFFYQLKQAKYDPSKITTPRESDCSASTSAVIIAAGYQCNNQRLQKISPENTTWTLRDALTSVGFVGYTDSKYTGGWDNLIPGDVLLNIQNHVCIFVGDAKVNGKVGAATGSLNMQQAISLLYSSDNYKFVNQKDSTKESILTSVLKQTVFDVINQKPAKDETVFGNKAFQQVIKFKSSLEETKTKEKKLTKGNLLSYPNLVEAPFIEVDLNGIKIGGYGNKEDKYPNNVTQLEIDKINGRINQYKISLINQVRAGEDPNFIDSLLSRTGVRNKLKIKYGDSAYGSFFKEDEAYIVDATYNEDVNSAKITYTINAVSSLGEVQQAYFNFPEVESKPSSEIIDLLYKNKNTSNQLLDLLPGMRNEQETLSRGLIPTDDDKVIIPGGENFSLVDRLTQLVSYMTDSSSPESSYFLSYEDSGDNNSIFKITKTTPTGDNDAIATNCYYVDVGYPGNSFVTRFEVSSDVYWPIFYKYSDNIIAYDYDIDYNGKLITKQINPVTIDDKYNSRRHALESWKNFVEAYPISATLTIKGLMKPVSLMEKVYVYSQFYGERDLATGLYSIIGQHDSISGNGYNTTLYLLKVT